MDIIILIIALTALLVGTFTDLKTREIPNWVNYSLIFIALGLRSFYALIYSNIMYLVYGAAGFTVFLILAYILYYTGQWGGGDSKLLIGLGALIGLEFTKETFLLGFFVNTLIVGAVYAILYSIILALTNRKKFAKSLKELLSSKKIIFIKRILFIFIVLLVILSLILQPIDLKLSLVIFALLTFVMFHVWTLVKAVENSCMFKLLAISKLTEGDWIAKDIIVKSRKIVGPKDLGISKKQIERLKKLHIRKVLVKQGIPFTPSFLIAFILTLYLGNIFLLLL